jgi:hypothetical protein
VFYPLPGRATLLALVLLPAALRAQTETPEPLTIDWTRTTIVSRTTPTLQVVVNPMLRRGSPIHDG